MLQPWWESIQCLFSFEKGQKDCPEACPEGGTLARLSAGAVGHSTGFAGVVSWGAIPFLDECTPLPAAL